MPKLRTITLRVLFVLLGLVFLAALIGAVYQSRMETAEAEEYQPLGQIIEVAGRKMHLNCQGFGTHTVILDSGLPGGWFLGWETVQAPISMFAKVCSYDRAGYGWSDGGEKPRMSSRIANELHELLKLAGIAPPYIMVGHSFGGLIFALMRINIRKKPLPLFL
jgi:pimeloyl-ACP methyl ester carboxylesterase